MHYCKAALRTVQASIKYKNQKSHFHLHVMTLWALQAFKSNCFRNDFLLMSRRPAVTVEGWKPTSRCFLLTMAWARVFWTRLTQRWYTGSQYGRKPLWSAVATEDRHWEGKAGRGLGEELTWTVSTDMVSCLKKDSGSVSKENSLLIKERDLCLHL